MQTSPRSLLGSLLLLALATSALDAQGVHLRGKVEDVPGTANQFLVDCTDVQLSSVAFDLNLFVGQQTELFGTWNGSTTAPAVVVTSITAVPKTFEVGGSGRIGEEIKLKVTSTPGDRTAMYLAEGAGFTSLGPGTVLLDLGTLQLAALGTVPAAGNLEVTIPVPNDTSLIGLDVHGQAGILPAVGPLVVSNPDCKTITQ